MGAYEYQNEVNELIEDQDELSYIAQDESWKVLDLATAVWVDEKIHEREIKIAEVEKVADDNIAALEAKIEKLKAWKETSTKVDKDRITFFKEHLHLWHEKLIISEKRTNAELKAQEKKEKKLSLTVKLPYRNLTCRNQSPEIIINGKSTAEAKKDETFVKYVKENSPEYIKTIEEVKWSEYKDSLKTSVVDGKLMYMDENGSPIEFIKLQQRGEKYDWKLTE